MALTQINLRPTRRELRQFGCIALAGFALLGGWVFWKGTLFGCDLGAAAPTVSYIFWGLAVLTGLFSIVAPQANRPLYILLIIVTWPIGFILSHVIMAIVFFGVITPIGLLFRLLGRDPLHRRFEPHTPSYWVPHAPPDNIERYFRQF